jgi:signal transduction histidine kinase
VTLGKEFVMAHKKNGPSKIAGKNPTNRPSDSAAVSAPPNSANENAQLLRQHAISLEQQVEHRVSVLSVLHDVTIAANQARSFDDALKAALERICHFYGWALGNAWRVNEDGALISGKVWQCTNEAHSVNPRLDALSISCERVHLPLDDDFIRDVIRTGREKWVTNLDFLRNRSGENPRELGLRSAVAFPVLFQDEPVAVLEFFSEAAIEPNEHLLEIMPQVCIQLGHVYERKRLEREVALVADKEHQRMAQEMHDGLSQQIAGIAMLTGGLVDSLRAEKHPTTEKALRLLNAVEDAKQQARRLARGLAPIEISASGLRAALEELAENTRKIYGLQCQLEVGQPPLDIDALLDASMEAFLATHLYKIAREAVHNAVQHAAAKRIWIELTASPENISLLIRDDGRGMGQNQPEGVGLRIMRHRAGLIGASLAIRPASEGGTIVTCSIER